MKSSNPNSIIKIAHYKSAVGLGLQDSWRPHIKKVGYTKEGKKVKEIVNVKVLQVEPMEKGVVAFEYVELKQ